MKKPWHAPFFETLDVRLTANGATYWPKEGTIVFRPDEGLDDEIIDVGPSVS